MGAAYRILWRQTSGAWVDQPGAEWRSEAEELSRSKATSAVWSSLQADSAWLVCFHEGAVVRELRFATALGAWEINRGPGMPFENVDALALWLRKWRMEKEPLTARDGKALVEAFVGTAKVPKKRPAARKKRKR